MNPEMKQKWLEALRSGKYQQGKHYLRTTQDQYCCLGVLCDLDGVEWKRSNSGCWDPTTQEGDYNFVGLGHRQHERLGITHVQSGHLMAMNDTGHTFLEIAEWIEEHL